MKLVALVASFLVATLAIAAEPATPESRAKFEQAILAAARAGDPATIGKLVQQSHAQNASLDESKVTQLLDGLVRSRELPAFTTLLEEMWKTPAGKDWQPNDTLLKEAVAEERTDFLDAFLARWLQLDRLSARAKDAPPKTAEWITRRVAEVRKTRADIDALVAASAKGELDAMRPLLDAGVSVDGVSTDHWTPLTRAASKNQVAAVKLLLERGAAVDKTRHPGWDYTALCLTRSVEVAEALKAAGTNVHARLFQRDVSILTYICRWGGADLVEWMLKQGLDPKMIGDNRKNLLSYAGDARTTELLLAAGVDPNVVDEFGRTPLMEAKNGIIALRLIEGGARVGSDNSLVLKMVQAYAGADAIEVVIKAQGKLSPSTAQMALISATHTDREEIVKMLLRNGADANKAGVWGGGDDMLPLMVCAIFGGAKSAKVLLENGADPNGGKEPGELLQTAVHNRHKEVAKLLHAAGAKGVSDLALFVALKDEAETKKLLQAAPSYAERPEFWDRALSTAARNGDLPVVRAALEKGVPLQPSPKEDAFAAAANEGQHEVLAELLAHRPKSGDAGELSQPLWNAVWNSHPYPTQRPAEAFEKCVKLLLDAGAPATSPKDGRGSLLSSAIFTRYPGGNGKVIELLVAAGADPNPVSAQGNGHLSDQIQDVYRQSGGSMLSSSTIETFERLAKVTIQR